MCAFVYGISIGVIGIVISISIFIGISISISNRIGTGIGIGISINSGIGIDSFLQSFNCLKETGTDRQTGRWTGKPMYGEAVPQKPYSWQ